MFLEFLHNVQHNLFKPLLLFFYLGFAIPLLRVPFVFPKQLYQALTLYLLVSIGWHGGEELAMLAPDELSRAIGFMVVGFFTNLGIGLLAYQILRAGTGLRKIDAAAVAGYYGSDSAGTFVTCLGVLTSANIAFAAYMPVMLAIMEIPGCLVALILISRLRRVGMDEDGNVVGEPGFKGVVAGKEGEGQRSIFDPEVLRDVFLNPGLYLLLGGIAVGYVARTQGPSVVAADDLLFVDLFQGVLCLFLLEMGMTAAKRLKDLRDAGWRFVAFGLLAPNVFAGIGMLVAHGYALVTGTPLELGSYVLFAVLCGAASYIAVPAVQRLAFPEASPTLPLAASLGLTFSYNVTIGIPLYLSLAGILAGVA
ncbi:sodium-dependent bicarbonate transport family permease [Pseudenhygromyxa sp. WMMC2535]|uniref:sodium-dependent bicarbonate transport family permease n=1 Tax=Pseudenhygromyxa sp. WMMC2535 TaxID=2712867 RepID=UPI001555FD5E|nr:sodium-dependent bicarbonate transport family permease [Pseudenhygromyxa sp. WMMC2535]NVB40486.1 sodium-dependent bicarbonate transport family permease [Pseudenhygromyxa sp. WMMC2535]